jgi:signal transduction histidine kinase
VRVAGLVALAVATTVMAAWQLDWHSFEVFAADYRMMTFNTALGLWLSSLSLILLAWPCRTSRRAEWLRDLSLLTAGLAATLATLTVMEMITGSQLGIDEIFAIDSLAREGHATRVPGRMSQATAASLLLLSTALMFCSARGLRPVARLYANACAGLALLLGAIACGSLLLGIDGVGRIQFFSTMGPHTAWIVSMLGVGVVLVQSAPQRPGWYLVGRQSATLSGFWLTLTVIAVFAPGLAVTAMISKRTADREVDAARARFDQLTERVVIEAQRRVYLPVYGLRGARGMFAGSEKVTREEFRAYVQARDLEREFPGTLGFGFIERVPRTELGSFLARERADGAQDFAIATTGEHDVLYPIKFIDPMETNRPAWGYDVGSEANRRHAVETALRTGEPTLTAPITLVQDEAQQPGFLFLLPLFEGDKLPETYEERVGALKGLVYAANVISGIFEDVLDVGDGALHFGVYDGPIASDATKLYEDVGGGVISMGPTASILNPRATFGASHQVEVGGRIWTIKTVSSPSFDAAMHSSQSSMIAVYGLILSSLAAGFIWRLGCSRADALALADTRTEDLLRTTEELRCSSETVARQNVELIAMAERAHRVVDDVSHEFRTPLAVIKEFASIIADGLAGPVSEQQAQYLKIMAGAVVDLNHMVEDLLDSSKLRSGRLRVERRRRPVEEIFDHGRATWARKASSRSIVIKERIDPDLPMVYVDEEKVRRVLTNLVTNAIKFSPEGSTILLTAAGDKHSDVVTLGVTDHGPGLSSQDIDSLFGRFHQCASGRRAESKGFGLGLSIARELAQLNLGEISVQSEKGHGATFSCTVPVAEASAVLGHYFRTIDSAERRDEGQLALLAVEVEGWCDADEVASFLASITYPTDVVLAADLRSEDDAPGVAPAQAGSWWILGRTGDPSAWVDRILRSRRSQMEEDQIELPSLSVEVRATWWYPAEATQAKDAIRRIMKGVRCHV